MRPRINEPLLPLARFTLFSLSVRASSCSTVSPLSAVISRSPLLTAAFSTTRVPVPTPWILTSPCWRDSTVSLPPTSTATASPSSCSMLPPAMSVRSSLVRSVCPTATLISWRDSRVTGMLSGSGLSIIKSRQAVTCRLPGTIVVSAGSVTVPVATSTRSSPSSTFSSSSSSSVISTLPRMGGGSMVLLAPPGRSISSPLLDDWVAHVISLAFSTTSWASRLAR